MIGVLALVAGATFVVDGFAARGLGPRREIGDEVEYRFRVTAADPLAHEPFVRVPLFPAFLWLAGKGGGARGLETALALAAMVSVAAATAATFSMFGPGAAVAGGLVLALTPDRLVMARRLWPDTLLATFVALLLAALAVLASTVVGTSEGAVGPSVSSPALAWLVGGLAACAVAVRIDALTLAALAASYGVVREMPWPPLVVPTLSVLVLVSARNRWSRGRWLPDDTPLFNLRLCLADRPGEPLEAKMGSTVAQWRRDSDADRHRVVLVFLTQALRRPAAFVRGVLERAASLTGADTFAIEKLVAADSGAYPEASPVLRRRLGSCLRWSFPVFLALAIASLTVDTGRHRLDLGLAAALLLPAALFTARTRFRFAALPCLAPGVGASLAALVSPEPARAALVIGVAGVLGWAFAHAPRRSERSIQTGQG